MAYKHYLGRCGMELNMQEWPYHAITDIRVRPGKSKGECLCFNTRPGLRTWMFKTIPARDKFVDKYGAKRIFSTREAAEFAAAR
jgi:hypothetical protein